MRKLIILTLIAVGLAGCANRRSPAGYGNFVRGATTAEDTLMADDVAKRLSTLYLPARTRINLRHATPDGFGTSLVAALRTKGYALAEFEPDRLPADNTATASGHSNDVALAYVVDQSGDVKQYRVTVHLNSQSVSRLYQAHDGAVAAVGYWVRKE